MNNENINELIIGLVGGAGADFNATKQVLRETLKSMCYRSENIIDCKVTDFFTTTNFNVLTNDNEKFSSLIGEIDSIKNSLNNDFSKTYIEMQLGSLGRSLIKGVDDFWARLIVKKISNNRTPSTAPKKTAYIINSLKTRKEISFLERVYGRNFIVISIYQHEDDRKKYLELEKIKSNIPKEEIDKLKDFNLLISAALSENTQPDSALDEVDISSPAAVLINKDKKETHQVFKKTGQQLDKCFSYGHFFIRSDYPPNPDKLNEQARRFIQLLFGHPFKEPSVEEFYMYCAQGAALRSLDLDRQIGSVIVNSHNELVSIGYNDVCKYKGGHFGPGDARDLRDYKKRFDYNHRKLDKLTNELLKVHSASSSPQSNAYNEVREILRAITEFKRSTHAEMSAILDAARRGVSIKNCTMFINTFPCHNCAKHIIASGIIKVVFLHPYPKSDAKDMFPEMICDHPGESNKNKVYFEHFTGVAPIRFDRVFQHGRKERQESHKGKYTGKVKDFNVTENQVPPFLEYRNAYVYESREQRVIDNLRAQDPLKPQAE